MSKKPLALAVDDSRHGSYRYGYVAFKCRCGLCTAAAHEQRALDENRKIMRKAGPTPDDRRPALTPANQHTLDTIVRLTYQEGQPPSLRELAQACGVGVTTTRYHALKLDEKGYIVYTPNVERGIAILCENA